MSEWEFLAQWGWVLRNYLHCVVLPKPVLSVTMADMAMFPWRTWEMAGQTE